MRLAHEAGVPLLVGTDVGVPLAYPGFSVHDELQLLVTQVGLTPLEALRAATLAPSQATSTADSIGTIASGYVADLVLRADDPLLDVGNAAHIRAVLVAGRLVLRSDLDRLLDAAAIEARATSAARRNPY